jgi:signal transduction histidine kinase
MDGKVIPLPDTRSTRPPQPIDPRRGRLPEPGEGWGSSEVGVRPEEDRSQRARPQQDQAQNDKVEALGRLAAVSSHEFNNLLTVIQGNTSFLLSRALDPEARQELEEIAMACERGKVFTDRLRQLSPRAWRSNQTIEISSFLRSLNPGRWISGEVVFLKELPSHPCSVQVHPDDLADAIRALVRNADQAVHSRGSRGSIRLRVESTPGESVDGKPSPGWIHLEVADDGPGMDEATAARATEPFFSTRRDPLGAGLGLSIALGVIRQSGGTMRIDTASGWGTRVHVWLPAAPRIQGLPRARS